MPDSAYHMGNPAPMQSQESGLPLRAGAALPAGVSKTSLGTGDGMPQGWAFDAEVPEMQGSGPAFRGSAAFPGVKTPKERVGKKAGKREWKWPWQKEKELTGERVIALNNHPMNADYASNFVSTSKYSAVTFVPKFFGGEYVANLQYFIANISQNNSLNMPTSSSYSLRASSKFLACHLQIATPPSRL